MTKFYRFEFGNWIRSKGSIVGEIDYDPLIRTSLEVTDVEIVFLS